MLSLAHPTGGFLQATRIMDLEIESLALIHIEKKFAALCLHFSIALVSGILVLNTQALRCSQRCQIPIGNTIPYGIPIQ